MPASSNPTFTSVADLFRHRVAATPNRMAFQFPMGDSGWGSITWQEAGDRVRDIASGLRALGVQNEQRCAILSSTRYEWVLADLGINCAGAATSTIYPSNTPGECAYILTDSDSKVVFVEDDTQVAKLIEVRDQLAGVQKVVVIDGASGHGGWVMTLAELEAQGRAHHQANPTAYNQVIDSIRAEDLCTLIYTSGTTGQPKGVQLRHDCWLAEGEWLDALGLVDIDDHQYLWLPLSHSFGKVLEALQLYVGFATTVDGRIPKLVDNLSVIKPTFMAAAPRIFEKVYNKVVAGAAEAGGLKLKILTWALKVGKAASRRIQAGGKPSGLLALQYAVADKLVFSKLRARFGGRLKFFVSGSAPLSRDMAEFFHSAGILILEGYGLTESSAASFINRPDTLRFGTVGLSLEGVRVRIDPEDGEVLLAGRSIMTGYHNMPEATAEVLTEDGWLRTGDIGELDEVGRLRITDRKKDLIKTSGGKYVAPQKLESRLKALCPYLGHVLVHGNARNFCTALVTFDEETIKGWAENNGLAGKNAREIAASPQAQAMVQEAIDVLNRDLARHETIKKFAILPSDFTVESGELTASMKVKRKAVETKYSNVLEGFYRDSLSAV